MKRIALLFSMVILTVPAHAFNLQDLLIPKTDNSAKPGTTQQSQENKPDFQALAKTLFGRTSTQDEERIGQQIAGDVLGATPLVRDAALQRYVNEVGRWVAAQSPRKDIKWYFGVLDTDDINAFAAPGGFIFITKGLYKQLNSEAELAGVLGHEIAHVTLRHHMKLLKESSIIGALGQVIGEQAKGSDQAVQNIIGNGAEIMARGLDKNAEFEADRLGAVLAARAGYEPWGLPTVLQDLTALPTGDSRTSLLYKTHPLPADRLAALGDAIGSRFDNLTDGKELKDRFYRIR